MILYQVGGVLNRRVNFTTENDSSGIYLKSIVRPSEGEVVASAEPEVELEPEVEPAVEEPEVEEPVRVLPTSINGFAVNPALQDPVPGPIDSREVDLAVKPNEVVYDSADYMGYKYPYTGISINHVETVSGGSKFDNRFNPAFVKKFEGFVKELEREAGVAVKVTFGNRTKEQQDALLKEGYTTSPISSHSLGTAADIFITDADGKTLWFGRHMATDARTKEVEKILNKAIENSGLYWGGNWTTFADKPHISLYSGVYNQAVTEKSSELLDVLTDEEVFNFYKRKLELAQTNEELQTIMGALTTLRETGTYPW